MPVKHRQRRAFALLGFELVEYYIESDYDAPIEKRRPPTWGTAIVRDGKDVMVIETHGEHTDDWRLRNKYVVKTKRGGTIRTFLSVWKLKREALLDAAVRLR